MKEDFLYQDFRGNAVLTEGALDIGAHQYMPPTPTWEFLEHNSSGGHLSVNGDNSGSDVNLVPITSTSNSEQ